MNTSRMHSHEARTDRKHPFGRWGMLAGAALALLLPLAGVALASPASAAPAAPASTGWLRFAHFAVGNGPVAVRLDGAVLDGHAVFEAVTPYRSVASGRHKLTVTDVARHVLANVSIPVTPGNAVTVTAVKGKTGLQVQWFDDDLSSGPAGHAKVRVIDTEPSQPSVSVKFRPEARDAVATAGTATTSAFSTAPATYGGASPYISLPAGRYDVDVTGTGTGGKTLVAGKNWPVAAGTVASLAVIHGTTGATLEVVSDAVGSTQTPVGSMATGFGGAADLLNGSHGVNLGLILVEVLGTVVAVGAMWLALRRSSGVWSRFVLASVGVVGVGVAGATVRSHGAPVPSRIAEGASTRPFVAAPSMAHTATVDLASAPTAAPRPAGMPTSLSIPAIGVRASIGSLGLNPDGSAQVPSNTTTVGWLSTGPMPGEAGPAVILGHVDSRSGPGVFFRLHELHAGSTIDVTVGAVVHRFAVESVQTYGKDKFPTATVFGAVPDRALRVVTCGGPFDRTIGHYKDNVVVFATEIDKSAAKGSPKVGE